MAFPADAVSPSDLACAAWKTAVGAKVARHSRAERLVRGRLIVGVEDAIWRRQLFTMRSLIVSNLNKSLGPGIVDEVEFRVAPPRREPQRAVVSSGADEADGIADPGLRRLFVASRKRERA
ncbi:MAG: DUF721 domain-containing protein [Bryobacteraceae bacterium]